MLQHVHHRVPVTSLAFADDNILLAANGNCLVAIDRLTRRVKARIPVFHDQAIHGIVIPESIAGVAIVWGGRLLASIHLQHNVNGEGDSLSLIVSSRQTVADWILNLCITSSSSADELISVITAHNALLLFRLSDLCAGGSCTACYETIGPNTSESDCILYSARVLWLDATTCLVVSGTAFGDVLVWSATISALNSTVTARCCQHYAFPAHEGSVFGVDVSTEYCISNTGKKLRLLASCSDDRTIRIWNITNLPDKLSSAVTLQRSTGFGSTIAANDESPQCLASQMGHISRVWQVRFLSADSEAAENIRLMSFGEDAHNIEWSISRAGPTDGTAEDNFTLRLIRSTHAHQGKHIWASALSSDGQITTGGADGAIALHEESIQITTEVLRSLLQNQESNDDYKTYAFLNDGTLIGSTERGSIFQMTFDDQGASSCRIVEPALHELGGYSIIASNGMYACFGGNTGAVYALFPGSFEVAKVFQGKGKVTGLFLDSSSAPGCGQHLIILFGATAAWLVPLREPHVSSDPRAAMCRQLRLPNNAIVTSFLSVRLSDHVFLICGTRNGDLVIYHTQESAEQEPHVVLDARHVHDKESVTSLKWIGGCLHSVARDGTHAVHRLVLAEEQAITLQTIHRATLPLGQNVEGLCLTEQDHIYVWGFRSKHFVVFDVTAQREIMTIECGGAHRSWAFWPSPAGGNFVWTRARQLFQFSQTRLPYRLLQEGGHGREIKTVAILDGVSRLIATGAEDTDIKIHTFDATGGFRCLQTLRKHITGIQHLQWWSFAADTDSDTEYLFSSGGCEEFYVWRCTRGVAGIGIGVVCESKHPRSGQSDLRVVNFDISAVGKDASQGFLLTAVYSDSTVSEWLYQRQQWSLLSTATYLTSCLTQVTSLNAELLLTASTDGHLALWTQDRSTEHLETPHHESRIPRQWQQRLRTHQSSILCMSSLTLADGSMLVASGGDDNALAVTRIGPTLAATMGEGSRTLLVPRAHATAVTGLAVRRVSEDTVWLFTGGIDQRLKVWEVRVDVGTPGVSTWKMQLREDVPTAVADLSSVVIYPCEDERIHVIVAGVGMDVWAVSILASSYEPGQSLQVRSRETSHQVE